MCLGCDSAMKLEGGGGGGGVAEVLGILRHRDVQVILASSWAWPAIFVAGKGRGVSFLFLLFLHCHSCSSFFPVPLFHLLYYSFYLFSPSLWETTQKDSQRLTCRVVKPQHNQICNETALLKGIYSIRHIQTPSFHD